MTDDKDEILHPLNALLKELPPNMAGTVKSGIDEIERLRQIALNQQQTVRTEISNRDTAKKERDQVTQENSELRAQLHQLTIENARLQGYQDRVREFDPIADKTLYGDQLNPIFVQPPPQRRHAYTDGAAASSMINHFDRPSERRPDWFQRRGI